MKFHNQVPDPRFLAGITIARNISIFPAPVELKSSLDELVAKHATVDMPEAIKAAIRNLLKGGGFKPSGRNKPASEYLAQAAREARFPRINNLVDVNNLLSLETGFPISLLDLDVVGGELTLRLGLPGEKYVFNAAGQEIDLAGLICACGASGKTPLGNPIKDSMAGKLSERTSSVIGIVYASTDVCTKERMQTISERFCELLRLHGKAEQTQAEIIG